MVPSRWSRLGLIVVLTAALGFIFAVAMSAQRTVRMHVAMGLAVEAQKQGAPACGGGFDAVATDDGDRGEDELTPPDHPSDLAIVPTRDADPRALRRIPEREPDSPFLALEEDPP